MVQEPEIPAHIGPMFGDSYWERMWTVFQSLSDLFSMRFETLQEAVGKPVVKTGKPEWAYEPSRWEAQKAGLLLPYIAALDQQRLREQFDIGRSLVAPIRERLEKRELSPQFLNDWGRFRAAASIIEFLYFSETSVGHKRSAIAGGKSRVENSEAHQRWFAHYFLRFYRRGYRTQAEEAVERLINAVIDGKISVPPGYDVKWFEEFLQLDDRSSDYCKLRPAFREDVLSAKRMEDLVTLGPGGIPPLDFKFPDP